MSYRAQTGTLGCPRSAPEVSPRTPERCTPGSSLPSGVDSRLLVACVRIPQHEPERRPVSITRTTGQKLEYLAPLFYQH